jgi:hypothetical protein
MGTLEREVFTSNVGDREWRQGSAQVIQWLTGSLRAAAQT